MYNRVALYSVLLIFCMVNGTVFAAAQKAKSEKEVFKSGQNYQTGQTVDFKRPNDYLVAWETHRTGVIKGNFKDIFRKEHVHEAAHLTTVVIYLMKIGIAEADTQKITKPIDTPLANVNDIYYITDPTGFSMLVHKSWIIGETVKTAVAKK